MKIHARRELTGKEKAIVAILCIPPVIVASAILAAFVFSLAAL